MIKPSVLVGFAVSLSAVLVGLCVYAGQRVNDVEGCILNRLTDEAQEIRESAGASCVGLSKQAVPILLQAIRDKRIIGMVNCKDEGCSYGWEAADALSKIGRPAVSGLVDALRDSDPAVRAQAATALGNIAPNEPMNVAPLGSALRDSDSWVRISAANALGKRGSAAKSAVRALTETLNDTSPKVWTWAAIALGDIGATAKSALPTLRRALQDDDGNVRDAAASAIEKILEQ